MTIQNVTSRPLGTVAVNPLSLPAWRPARDGLVVHWARHLRHDCGWPIPDERGLRFLAERATELLAQIAAEPLEAFRWFAYESTYDFGEGFTEAVNDLVEPSWIVRLYPRQVANLPNAREWLRAARAR